MARSRGELEVAALLTTHAAADGRVAIHGTPIALVEAQAEAVGLPLWRVALPSPCPDRDYEAALQPVLARAVREGFSAIVFGDLFLEDIRRYRERQLAGSGLRPVFPLWRMPTAELAHAMVRDGLLATVTCVDGRSLDASFAGRPFDAALLRDLPPGVDRCGENGEFHTFAHGGPMFARCVPVATGAVRERDGFHVVDLASPDSSVRHEGAHLQ